MKKKRPPKTIKEKKWLAKTIEYGNGTKAAQEVYAVSSAQSAANIASQNYRKLQMDDALKAKGIHPGYLIDKGKEGLENANKIHGTKDDFIETPDYGVRHKYLETFLRLKGHGQTGVQVNQQINMGKVYVKLPERK